MGDPGAGELVNIDTGELPSEFVNEAVPMPPTGTSGFTCESLHLENSQTGDKIWIK